MAVSNRVNRIGLGLAALLCVVVPRTSRAEIAFERLAPAIAGGAGARALERGSWFSASSGWRGRAPNGSRWVAAQRGLYVLRGSRHPEALELGASLGSSSVWSPPRHLLMDHARTAMQWDAAAGAGRKGGQGVVIGIIDSGIDAGHPDLRTFDGRTRVAWLLDFFKSPAGTQPELEQRYACESAEGLHCQILDARDIDERLNNDVLGDEPKDELGHGTHVASIAAGNGTAEPSGRFTGVAPEATLIVVRASGSAGTLSDDDIVLGTQFIFDRAEELGMPAVVNLSLGSDFGPHDASSALGGALAGLVGLDQPGRAIVVAAGNSGGVLRGNTSAGPEPFGIHTGVQVRAQATAQVLLLTPPPLSGAETTDATLYVWIELQPADALRIGLDGPNGLHLDPVAPGDSGSARADELAVVVINGAGLGDASQFVGGVLSDRAEAPVLPERAGTAVLLLDGRWPAGQTFTLNLEGSGHAELWLQSEGDLGPGLHPTGALFARATSQQTVTVPAAHPGLIAVGASVNRLGWIDRSGAEVVVQHPPFEPEFTLGAAAFFSSSGPNSSGAFKPELTAPGGFVIAALAAQADPRKNLAGIFASGSVCSRLLDCQVVDAWHAATGGTSMAAPMVSGAIALLFERDPSLTQPQLRALLQTGAEPLVPDVEAASREGAGGLALERSFRAQQGTASSTGEPDPRRSRLLFASTVAAPDPASSLEVLLQLRDAEGAPVDGFEQSRLALQVSGGQFNSEPARTAPGLYMMRVSAFASSRQQLTVEVRFDGAPLLSGTLPVAEDEAAPDGAALGDGGGGCALNRGNASHQSRGNAVQLLALAFALGLRLRRNAPLRNTG